MNKRPIVVLLAAALSPMASAVLAAEDTVDIPRLVVTSDPLGNRTSDELIQPVTVIAGDELNQKRASTIGETLDGLPGVHNADFGQGVGRPVVRGLQGSRVKVLEDGLSTSDISGEGADHAIGMDVGRADQIEVFRGPATLLYGSGAAGGVINVRSNRFNPEFGDAPRVDGQMSYGINGHDRQGRLGLELPLGDSFVLRTDYGVRRSSDFDIDGYQQKDQQVGRKDKLQNSEVENDVFSITGLYKGDWGFAGLGYSTWETQYGIPEVFLGQGEEEQERIRAKNDRFDFRSEINDPLPGFSAARLKMAYTSYRQQEIGSEFDNGAFVESEVETRFNNNETEMRLEMVHNPIGDWEGVVGLQFNDRDFEAEGEGHGHGDGDEHGGGFYIRGNDTRTVGLFVLEELPTHFGRFEIAARVDHVRSSTDDLGEARDIDLPSGEELQQSAILGSNSFTPFSLSAGTIIDVDPAHHLRFSVTRSQRAPSAEQLYAFGSHAAAGTVEIGDPNLGKETYTNFEVGFDRHVGAFRYELTTFYNYVDDFIYLAAQNDGTGQAIEIEGDTLVVNEQQNAKLYGAEFGAITDLIDGPIPLSMRLSADHVRGKLSNGENIPRMSPTRLGIGFDTSYADWDFSLDYRRVFKQTKTAVTESNTDGYNLVSFDANWSPASLKGAEIFIQGRNLLNEDGRRHTSFFKDESPILGRTIYTGIRFDFGG